MTFADIISIGIIAIFATVLYWALDKFGGKSNPRVIYLLFSPDIANFARNRPLYFYHLSNPCAAVMFDCDEFDERFQIISRKEDTTC